MKQVIAWCAVVMFVGASMAGCNAGEACCDCLIENGCWESDDYACYYYYDESYPGAREDPPPGQTWEIACQDEFCAECDDVHSNFRM